jgi:hypothetical protein
MTGIAADGGEAGNNGTRHRGQQPGAVERRPQRHGEQHDGERGVAYWRDGAIEPYERCPAHRASHATTAATPYLVGVTESRDSVVEPTMWRLSR